MTPKEKAFQLLNDYVVLSINVTYINEYGNFCTTQGDITYQSAKQCALIAVDELINQEQSYNNGSFYPSDYWSTVKQEIEKL